MTRRSMIVFLAALTLAGCGESRLAPTGTGTGSGSAPGSGSGGGGSNCQTLATLRQCVARGGSNVLREGVVVASTATRLTLELPVEYASSRRAQGVEAVLTGPNGTFEFRRVGDPCPVVADMPGVDATVIRDFGVLVGLPAGTYELRIVHGLGGNPCYVPPPDADRNADNYVVVGIGTLTVCNP